MGSLNPGASIFGKHFTPAGIGVHHMGMRLIGVYFVGVYFMGVHLIGAHLTGACILQAYTS
jgi:hypothetical protein